MNPIYFDKIQRRDIADLVGCYSARELESAFRSTVPLLALVRDETALLDEILVRCGLTGPSALHFEFQVSPKKGRGKASHTDLMVCATDQCMAMEAKWTEPAYESVGDWLKGSSVPGEEGESNRNDVLSGWIDLLRLRTTRAITVDELKGLAYQTVHRAASACSVGTAPQLAYLQFTPPLHVDAAGRDKRLADLVALRGVLGSGCAFPLRLIDVDLEPTPELETLAKLPKAPETALAVKDALVSKRLFVFRGFDMHEVR